MSSPSFDGYRTIQDFRSQWQNLITSHPLYLSIKTWDHTLSDAPQNLADAWREEIVSISLENNVTLYDQSAVIRVDRQTPFHFPIQVRCPRPT